MESNSDSSLEREQRATKVSSILPVPIDQQEMKERKGKLIKSNFIVQRKDMIGSKLNFNTPSELKEIIEDNSGKVLDINEIGVKESESDDKSVTQKSSENLQDKSQLQREFLNPNEEVRIRIRKNSLPTLARSVRSISLNHYFRCLVIRT